MGGGFSNLAHVSSDGSFSWKDVPPGTYSVQISDVSAMPDWFLKSAAADGHDATDSGFSVGASAITLDLMASANGATVDGVAGDQNDEPVADAVIVAVPEARFRNRPDRYRKAVCGSERTLQFARPASGRLRVVRMGERRRRAVLQRRIHKKL